MPLKGKCTKQARMESTGRPLARDKTQFHEFYDKKWDAESFRSV